MPKLHASVFKFKLHFLWVKKSQDIKIKKQKPSCRGVTSLLGGQKYPVWHSAVKRQKWKPARRGLPFQTYMKQCHITKTNFRKLSERLIHRGAVFHHLILLQWIAQRSAEGQTERKSTNVWVTDRYKLRHFHNLVSQDVNVVSNISGFDWVSNTVFVLLTLQTLGVRFLHYIHLKHTSHNMSGLILD